LAKSSLNGGGTALLDASMANDMNEDWDTNETDIPDSGSLLRKQKPHQMQQNYANFQMVSCFFWRAGCVKVIDN
jgi:hypothetical protein